MFHTRVWGWTNGTAACPAHEEGEGGGWRRGCSVAHWMYVRSAVQVDRLAVTFEPMLLRFSIAAVSPLDSLPQWMKAAVLKWFCCCIRVDLRSLPCWSSRTHKRTHTGAERYMFLLKLKWGKVHGWVAPWWVHIRRTCFCERTATISRHWCGFFFFPT